MEAQKELRVIAETLVVAQISEESPAREVFLNPWLFKDIMKLVTGEPKIEFVMVSGGFGQQTTEIYSISTNSWRIGPNLPQVRCQHGMALVDIGHGQREIFVIGGHADGDALKSVVSLTIPTTSEIEMTMKWKVMPDLKVKRSSPGIGVVDGKIYVIGGWNGSEFLKTTEVFSVKEGKWIDSQVPQEMSTGRMSMGVAVIGKKIFVIGGFNRTRGHLSAVEVLDTKTNRWSTLPSLTRISESMAIAVIDDRFIFSCGGRNTFGSTEIIEIFDVERNEWSIPAFRLTHPQFGIMAVAANNSIFIVDTRIISILDIDEAKWSLSPPKPCQICGSAIGF